MQAVREKQRLICNETPTKLEADLSDEIIPSRLECYINKIFSVKDSQPRVFYLYYLFGGFWVTLICTQS